VSPICPRDGSILSPHMATAPMNPCLRAIPASQGNFPDRDVHAKITKDPDEAPSPWVRVQPTVLPDSAITALPLLSCSTAEGLLLPTELVTLKSRHGLGSNGGGRPLLRGSQACSEFNSDLGGGNRSEVRALCVAAGKTVGSVSPVRANRREPTLTQRSH
jgi:hypothetical protein